jgi:TATA-box binding protein (TBP) (component of TFIID and TFIIIB)
MVDSIEDYNNNVSLCKSPDNIASDLVVAVMTVCAELNCVIDLNKIYQMYQDDCSLFNDDFKITFAQNSKKNTDGRKNKAFYNCLSLSFFYTDLGLKSKVVAKIFPNGSVQIPGCRTIGSVYEAPKIVFNFILNLFKLCPNIIKSGELNLSAIRIVMINSNFYFKHNQNNVGINQEKLKDLINKYKFTGDTSNKLNKWRFATYQPEKYAGVNIRYLTDSARTMYSECFSGTKKIPKKINGQISIFIFRSGKGTITAAKNTKDLLEAYHSICDIVRSHKNQLFYI